MNTGSKKIAFCTISDNSYYEPCSVMIYSFLKNNNWYDGDIIVFYDDLTEENKSKIMRVSNKIKFSQINTDDYNLIFKATNGITADTLKKAFYKFDIFKLYDYDFVVWADSDMVIIKDIREIFEFDYDFGWCEDRVSNENYKYFNAGFFFFKTEKIKDGSFYQDLFNFTENLKRDSFKKELTFRGLYADQCVLNERVDMFFENIISLPADLYNVPQTENNFVKVINSKIIHYCGGYKTWTVDNPHYVSHYIWYQYYYLMNKNVILK